MKLKIFNIESIGQTDTVERQINEWLATGKIVVKTDVTSATVGPAEDQWQTIAIFIWYRESE